MMAEFRVTLSLIKQVDFDRVVRRDSIDECYSFFALLPPSPFARFPSLPFI